MCGLNIYMPLCTTPLTVSVIFVSFNFSFIGIRVQKLYIHHTAEEVVILLSQRGKDVVYDYNWFMYKIFKYHQCCFIIAFHKL